MIRRVMFATAGLEEDDGDEAELRGSIQSVNGTVPNLTLTIAGQTVLTSASTVLRPRGNVVGFDALRVSGEVEVEGRRRGEGRSWPGRSRSKTMATRAGKWR